MNRKRSVPWVCSIVVNLYTPETENYSSQYNAIIDNN